MVNKHCFNCLDTSLPTLYYSFLLIIGHLGSTYVENLNMSNWIFFLQKWWFFWKILWTNHKTFFFSFSSFFLNFRFSKIP
jgi:hypothetical protein